jgi:hypothetical protein
MPFTQAMPHKVAYRQRGPAEPRPGLRWVFTSRCPRGWRALLERSGGSVFHSPTGLAAAGPPGVPLFAELYQGDDVAGLAAGVASRCRLGFKARHFYFPTVPVVSEPSRRDEALDALVAQLRAAGAADVLVDSYDGAWQPAPRRAAETRDRLEYVARLARTRDELASGCSKHHRRHIQRGERDGWARRALDGEEARGLLAAVQREASARAAERGDPFTAAMAPDVALTSPESGAPWGMVVWSAWQDATPLAAVLVGWANRRAFYLIGGSTAAGYERDAAQWLHWRIMCTLADHGFTHYNLGGTPASAASPGDPANGLYRFKTGFGAEVVSCRSVHWTLRPGHARAHRVVRWVAARLRP